MTIREIYKNSEQFLNKEVKLGGWIRSIRGSKHFGFLVLHDAVPSAKAQTAVPELAAKSVP